MGIAETMQHLETYGGVSKGKLEKRPLENGDCSSPVLPKYKRRRVSAIRDFPEGCGRNALPINRRPIGIMDSIGIDENLVCTNKDTADLETDTVKASGTNDEIQSAIRDCPEGCGRNAPPINLRPTGIIDSVGIDENLVCRNKDTSDLETDTLKASGTNDEIQSAIRDFPEGCGRNAPPFNLRPMGIMDSVGIDENLVCRNKDTADLETDTVKASGTNDEIQSSIPDFPEGCGRNASPINLRPVGIMDSVGIDENLLCRNKDTADLETDTVKACGTDDEIRSPKLVQSSVQIEVLGCPNNLNSDVGKVLANTAEGPELMNAESGGNERPLALDSAILGDPVQPLEHAEDSHKVETAIPTEDMVQIRDLKVQSPPTWPITEAKFVETTLTWKYPPRRKISAIRDFPLLCGRDALHLSKEDRMKAVDSSKSTSLVQETSVMEEKLLSNRLRTISGDREKNFQKEGNLKSEYRFNAKVEPEADDHLNHKSYPNDNKGDMDEACIEGKVRKEIVVSEEFGSMEGEMGKEIVVYDGGGLGGENGKEMVVYDIGVGGLDGKVEKEVVLHKKKKGVKRISSGFSGRAIQYYAQDVGSELAVDWVIVQGLMAAPNCPWRQRKAAVEQKQSTGMQRSNGKRHVFSDQGNSKSIIRRKKVGRGSLGGQSVENKFSCTSMATYHGLGKPVEVDHFEHDEVLEDFHVAHRPTTVNVNLTPFSQSVSCRKADDSDAVVTRNKVRETLRLFQVVYRKLLQEEEGKSKQGGHGLKRIDIHAAMILKDKNKYVNTNKILGPVPGIEVGDEFHYRVELAIVGLHGPLQPGIAYIKRRGEIIATSIVASGGYADDLDNADMLIYSGSGGKKTGGGGQPEDQKLERGNLALKNCIHAKTPVRVIRGFREKGSDSSDARGKMVMTYTYDGIYLVEKYWQEPGSHDSLVFKFRLVRIPGQPQLAWNEVKKSKKYKIREGLCVNDISQGKEVIPICAVNNIDDEKPPPFTYITSVIYPNWCNPLPPRGCSCTDGCLDSNRCSCAVKNGGEIPYNFNGAIVEAKPLVYECGPSCKCRPSCYNRVTQHGIKFQLEIFKTESRGWGVRSLNSIPSGSFICEYLGELLEDKEAEERTGNDEYLFDIGQNYDDHSLRDEVSNIMPNTHSSSCEGVEDVGFTIDAAYYGNVGRFINHSCSPNLYAQNVLHDHEDRRMPHIMFFAAENVPPLQELTYHYNYTIDQVRDSNGNIKKKSCYCGSPECTGRMY